VPDVPAGIPRQAGGICVQLAVGDALGRNQVSQRRTTVLPRRGTNRRNLPSPPVANAAPQTPQTPEASGILRWTSEVGGNSFLLPHSGQAIQRS
jgi:hypothetical protein